MDRVEEYRLAQKATEARIRDIDRIQDWNEFFQEGYLVHKPPAPLGLFVTGLDPTLGRSIPLRSRVRDLQWSPASVHPILEVFPRLDLVLVVQLVLSLFVVLLTYDAVCGEKERGTLSLIASHPVPRHRLLLSKLIGALATLLAAFGLPLFAGISVVLLLPSTNLGNGDLFRLAMITMTLALYLCVFACAGILASSLTHRAPTAFVLLLAFWVVTVILLPRLSLVVASGVRPPPSAHLAEAEKAILYNDHLQRRLDLHGKWREEHPGWRDTPEGRDAHSAYFQWTREHFGEIRRKENHRIDEAFRNRRRAWLDLATVLARLSPAFAVNNASVTLAATGIDRHQRFSDRAQEHGKTHLRWVIDSKNRARQQQANPEAHGEYRWDISDMPRFVYARSRMDADVSTGLSDVALLVLWAALLFSGASVAVLRYDLR